MLKQIHQQFYQTSLYLNTSNLANVKYIVINNIETNYGKQEILDAIRSNFKRNELSKTEYKEQDPYC